MRLRRKLADITHRNVERQSPFDRLPLYYVLEGPIEPDDIRFIEILICHEVVNTRLEPTNKRS
jgi:hypothetical protein